MTRTVVVTGAAGGLGRATTEHLVSQGWDVVAADLPGPALDALRDRAGITPVEVDVTDPTSVEALAAAAPDRVHGVVTFAGVLAVGSVAEIPDADMRRIVDVNLLGTYRVVRTLFDRVVAARGRVVLISSETGWQTAAPFNGPYALTKHAVEAYGDSLRREAALVGVKVVKVQPGPFRTEMVGSIERQFERAASTSRHFAPLLRRMGPMAAREAGKAHDPAELAAVVHEALTTRHPKRAYSVHPDPMRSRMEWLPTAVTDRLVVTALRRMNR